jgi:hypothetical protein
MSAQHWEAVNVARSAYAGPQRAAIHSLVEHDQLRSFPIDVMVYGRRDCPNAEA